MFKIRHYLSGDGRDVFAEWRETLLDNKAKIDLGLKSSALSVAPAKAGAQKCSRKSIDFIGFNCAVLDSRVRGNDEKRKPHFKPKPVYTDAFIAIEKAYGRFARTHHERQSTRRSNG